MKGHGPGWRGEDGLKILFWHRTNRMWWWIIFQSWKTEQSKITSSFMEGEVYILVDLYWTYGIWGSCETSKWRWWAGKWSNGQGTRTTVMTPVVGKEPRVVSWTPREENALRKESFWMLLWEQRRWRQRSAHSAGQYGHCWKPWWEQFKKHYGNRCHSLLLGEVPNGGEEEETESISKS